MLRVISGQCLDHVVSVSGILDDCIAGPVIDLDGADAADVSQIVFQDASLRNYFNTFQWYDGYRDEIPASELNKFEKYNIQFIQRYE